LKGRVNVGFNIGFFRKALIVGQFVASIIMIICTITVARQLDFLQDKNLGFDKEHVIIVPTNKRRVEGMPLADRYINELKANPAVMNATVSMYSMAESGWMTMGYTDDQKVFRRFAFNSVDVDFLSSMKLEIAEGRGFQKGNTSDSNVIVVNEALVKEYGWEDPIGQKLPGKYPQQIIGVVKDFHLESLHTPIRPAVLAIKPDSIFANSSDVTYNFSPQPRISVRFRPGNLQDHVKLLKATWKSVAGDQDFDYKFLDESLAAAYEQEQRMKTMVQYASYLSIFIACMGLFGLATLVVVRRTKEIGIRKVLGANVGRIVTLLSKDFIIMVLVASLIAFPIAWWALHTWLEDFAYRINIPWWVFLMAAVIALLVALVTVGTQAIKAALTNPVKSLRTE
jgi:putative ABC transport system permease protein